MVTGFLFACWLLYEFDKKVYEVEIVKSRYRKMWQKIVQTHVHAYSQSCI